MDTSLAEEVQQTMATLAPNRFFFMSPYRSFTTSGCFARFDEPAVNGDSPDSPFQQKLAALFADAKAQGHQKSGDGRGDSLRSTSAFVAVYSRILAVVLPPGKTDLSPPFYPQPVAERGGTPGNS
ncbi:isochorismate synthase [Escherichia coli]|uniref:Isochorismate synthase n=1 Tax=Escherichia coli TaxID=562 RepID=A0A377B056_ECOLX|nr:isochorismate synthase [Escherichia coli]